MTDDTRRTDAADPAAAGTEHGTTPETGTPRDAEARPGAAEAETEAAAAEATEAAAQAAASTAAAPPPETEAPSEPETPEIEARLAELEAENATLKDQTLRLYAEMENLRKRTEREKKEARDYAGQSLARDLLGVHDNLGRALESVDDEARAAAAALIEGVELTRKELLSAFEKHNIAKVEPEIGAKFDPQLHEAMFEAPVPGATPGTVIQVMETGFTISGRLLRPARVGVAAHQPEGGAG